MKATILPYILLILPYCLLGQDIDRMKQAIDSLTKEKEWFVANYQSKLKNYERKIDSLKVKAAETIEKGITETTSKINQIIGAGLKVEVKDAINLSSDLSLNSNGMLIPVKKIVILNKRMDSRCFALITYNKIYKGYTPMYNLVLPPQIDSLEKKLKKFIGADYFPINVPQSSNSSQPMAKPQTYSSSPTYSAPATKECNTVQCAGRTKKGDRCMNMTKNCNGRCHYH